MARITVLGGTGFLGGHAISRLLANGHEVRAIGRSPRGADLPAGIEIVHGGVTVPGTLPAEFAGVGRILRLTGMFAQPAYAAHPWEQAKVRGASLLLDGPVPTTVFRVGFVNETLARFVRGGRPVLLGRRPHPIRPIAADDVMASASRAIDLPNTADPYLRRHRHRCLVARRRRPGTTERTSS